MKTTSRTNMKITEVLTTKKTVTRIMTTRFILTTKITTTGMVTILARVTMKGFSG